MPFLFCKILEQINLVGEILYITSWLLTLTQYDNSHLFNIIVWIKIVSDTTSNFFKALIRISVNSPSLELTIVIMQYLVLYYCCMLCIIAGNTIGKQSTIKISWMWRICLDLWDTSIIYQTNSFHCQYCLMHKMNAI